MKQFGTTFPWQNSTTFRQGVNCSSVGAGRTLNGDLGSMDGVSEWLYLKYAANCEKRNRFFVFCLSEAPQKILCLSAFSYDLFYVLSWIQTISCLKIDPSDLLYLEFYIFTLLLLASESTGCFKLSSYLSKMYRTSDFSLNETQHTSSSHTRI